MDVIASVNFRLDPNALRRRLDPVPILREMGEMKVTEMVLSLGKKGGPLGGLSAAGEPPISRRGLAGFAGHFTYQITEGGRCLRYGNSAICARILFLGGVIVPRTRRALTVPIARESYGKRAADFPGLFRLRGTNVLAIEKQRGRRKAEKHTEIIPLFALVQQVRIQPHPYALPWTERNMAALYSAIARRLAAPA